MNRLEILVANGSIESRDMVVFAMSMEATVLLKSPSHGTYFISVKSTWFRTYIAEAIGDVDDCYSSIFYDALTEVSVLGERTTTYYVVVIYPGKRRVVPAAVFR